MTTTPTQLADRIKAEFDSRRQRIEKAEHERVADAQAKEKRVEQFVKTCDSLQEIWRPRLEEFAKQFGEQITVKPNITPALREAKVMFNTDLATMTLTLSVAPDMDVTKMVVESDLLILPILFEYDRHARLEMPLDKIDRDALARWIDDRLVACVKAYLSIHDNQFYLKRAMVEDPETKTKLLPAEAAARLEHNGHTYYFATDESCRQFKEKHQIK
ncbi:MAG: hypothetical protein GIKADHBN_01454 [Phycisphaerales bacterium]|nr:hypothetical protein [Phycisphaerales bacterium]